MSDGPFLPIDGARLIGRQRIMDAVGATRGGGVHRLALGPADTEARALLIGWACARGFTVETDEAANLFFTRPGRDPGLLPVAMGSHTDSQPHAGRFDGMTGVLAAFEVLEALEDRNASHEAPVICAVWTSEEGGARFPHGTIGSSLYAATRDKAAMMDQTDNQGIRFAEAVAGFHAAFPDLKRREPGGRFAAFLELHIEQARALQDSGNRIGVVTAIQGLRRYRVSVTGEEAHAGTTPRLHRRDALNGATALIAALRAACLDEADLLRFTVGQMSVLPGSAAVVPGRVEFTIDLRHPERQILDGTTAEFRRLAALGAEGCEAAIEEMSRSDPTVFADPLVERIDAAARRRGYPAMRLVSGANHDAANIARLSGQTGMIFIPCLDGISHNEKETASDADILAGTEVLADTVADLAGLWG